MPSTAKLGDPNNLGAPRWFNTSCFTLNAPLIPGNLGLATMHGPPQRRLDVVLAKSVHITDRQSVQIRFESYNITNTASFQPPAANLGDTTFGSISSTGNAPPRSMQFGLKYLF